MALQTLSEPIRPVISVNGLGKRYDFSHKREWALFGTRALGMVEADGHMALSDVSFDIAAGEAVGILGRNGAGKSTLLQIITGTLRPTTGTVSVHGRVSALLELGAGFNPEFTGRENVYLCGAVLGMSRREMDEKYAEIVAFADIGDFVDRPVKTYSSGMLVRLAFALQVHVDPDILIVDEALSVGDIFFQQKCINKIKEILARGVTLLFVSHSLNSVKSLCSRAIFLKGGQVVADDVAEKVCDLYQNSMSSSSGGDLALALEQSRLEGAHESSFVIVDAGLDQKLDEASFDARLSQRSGSGEVRLTGFSIVREGGGATVALDQCGPVRLRVGLTAEQSVPAGASIGLLVRDANGVDLVAYNSNFFNTFLPALEQGRSYVWELDVDLPLARGYYSFHCGIKPNSSSQFFYDRCFSIGVLEVEGNPLAWGDYGGRIIHSPKAMQLKRIERAGH